MFRFNMPYIHLCLQCKYTFISGLFQSVCLRIQFLTMIKCLLSVLYKYKDEQKDRPLFHSYGYFDILFTYN
jgi:hypothetical protein